MKKFIFLILVHSFRAIAANEMALIQYNADLHFADSAYNLRRLTQLAEEAVGKGAKIIVLPEGAIHGYADSRSYWCAGEKYWDQKCRDVASIAEAIPEGPVSQYWAQFAKQRQVFVAYNLPEYDEGKFYNSTAVVGPQGLVAHYRKRSLYYIDTYYAEPGNLGPQTLTTPYGVFGLLICADANVNLYFSQYTQMGVKQIIMPMDWDQSPTAGDRAGRIYFALRAKETKQTLYVSDVSPWDGTGKYSPNRPTRERRGLPDIAIGVDGISYHDLN